MARARSAHGSAGPGGARPPRVAAAASGDGGPDAPRVGRLRDVLGAERLRRLLASGRGGHAYLLVGPEGSGRRTAAWALATALLCQRPEPDGDACGACPACRAMAWGTHPDARELAGHRLEDARALTRSAALRPAQGGRAVFILADADAMTPEAAAALLKPVEEPAGAAVFILTAVSSDHVPETIVSRCQVLPLLPVAAEDLAAWLAARGVPQDQAHELAEAAGGRPGRALAMARDPGWRQRRQAARDWLSELAGCSLAEALAKAAMAAEATDLEEVLAALRDTAVRAALSGDRASLLAACDGFAAARAAAAALEGHVTARLTWEVLGVRLRRIAPVRYNLPKL
jgi:DNA polymerase-3 subunit delta'